MLEGEIHLVLTDLPPTAKVRHLKMLIQQNSRYPAYKLRFVYNGQVLRDEKSFEFYRITYDTPIRVLLCMGPSVPAA